MNPVYFFCRANLAVKSNFGNSHLRIFYNIMRGRSLEKELNSHYKTKNGTIDILRFIQDLHIAFSNRKKLNLDKFDFNFISKLFLPQHQRIEIQKLALKIIFSNCQFTDSHIDRLFSQQKELSPQSLQELVDAGKAARRFILHIIAKIPEKDRTEESIHKIIALFKGELFGFVGIQKLGDAILSCDEEDRMDVINTAQPFISKIIGIDRADFINAIIKTPAMNRNIVPIAMPLLETMTSNYYGGILKLIQKIPEAERVNFIQTAMIVTQGVVSESQKYALIFSLKDISLLDRAVIATQVAPVLSSIPDGISRKAFIDVINKLPKDHRYPEVIEATAFIFRNMPWKEARHIQETINNMPEESRAETILKAIPHIEKLYKYIDMEKNYARATILHICSQENGIVLLERPIPSCDIPLSPYKIFLIQLILPFFPEKARTPDLVKKIAIELGRPSKSDYLYAMNILSIFPIESRMNPGLKSLVATLSPHFFLSTLEKIWATVNFISPDKWDVTIHKQHNLKSETRVNQRSMEMISFLYNSQDIREASHQYIKKLLVSNASPQTKWDLAQTILKNPAFFHLHEEDELVQLAIEIASVCDPDALKNPKNPYRIYRDIKNAIGSEGWVSIEETAHSIAGEQVRWNFAKMRDKGVWKGYTFKDLPSGISPNTLKILFDELEQRLDKLPNNKRYYVEKYIQDSCEDPLKNLHANLLDKPFLSELLTRNSIDGSVSPAQFQLYAVLRFILDASPVIRGDEIVSEREDLLLKMSASVQNCSTGQRDGLANFYNLLPLKYKHGPQANVGAIAVAENFVDTCVQRALNSTFTNIGLLKELCGTDILYQPSHITEYLKNRYHKQVGLHHQLVLDMHTGVLYDQLLKNKTEDVLKRFFEYCTPKAVIHQVMSDSKEGIKLGIFIGIQSLLKQVVGDISESEDYERYWSFTEFLELQQLTELGALVLLKATGYLY